MKRRPLPSAGELTSSGAVNPLATVASFNWIGPCWMIGSGGVGPGMGAALRFVSDMTNNRDTAAIAARFETLRSIRCCLPTVVVTFNVLGNMDVIAVNLLFGCVRFAFIISPVEGLIKRLCCLSLETAP